MKTQVISIDYKLLSEKGVEEMKHLVCDYNELKKSGKQAFEIDRKPVVVVLSQDGQVYALKDVCPHKGPCLSEGMVDKNCSANGVGEYIYESGREVIRCPWHSWEFDIKTGESLFAPDKVKVKTYDVSIEDEKVFVTL